LIKKEYAGSLGEVGYLSFPLLDGAGADILILASDVGCDA
jgi:hypothetical protein